MFWIEFLQSNSRVGTVVWVRPFRHLGHSRVELSFGPVALLEKGWMRKGGTKLFAKFMTLSCTAPSLSDLRGAVCTEHERNWLCIKAEGVVKTRDYCSLPFLFFLYK